MAQVPFEQQQQATQAMLQAVMKQLVRNAKRDGLSPRLLQLLPHIPLMHTDDYEDLLQLAETGGTSVVYGCCAYLQCTGQDSVHSSIYRWQPVLASLRLSCSAASNSSHWHVT
jgi:hypothetical protein